MTELALKIVIVASLLYISWQDIMDRMVYWLSYLITGTLGFLLHVQEVGLLPSLASVGINLVLVVVLILIAFCYSRFIMKRGFINESIGSGDILFFILLTLAFPTITFIILFVFSLIFALCLYKIVSVQELDKDIPLAGYMSIFYTGVYFVSIFIAPKYLFA